MTATTARQTVPERLLPWSLGEPDVVLATYAGVARIFGGAPVMFFALEVFYMTRWKTLLVVGGAVLSLVIVRAAYPEQRAHAQDLRGTASEYLAAVMLSPGDSGLSGYWLIGADNLAIAASGTELAARRADFEASPRGAPRLRNFRITGRIFSAAETARFVVDAFREGRSFRDADGNTIEYEWMGSIPEIPEFAEIDHGEFFRFVRRRADGQIVETGTGAAWRRGAVQFTISAAGPTGFDNSDEVVRLLTVQDTKAARLGPFRPLNPPTLRPAGPRPSGDAPTGMGVIGTAVLSGALARDGAEVTARINETVCGRGTTLFGFFLFSVESAAQVPGCGTPGAVVRFAVNGNPVEQTLAWGTENLYTPVNLTAAAEQQVADRLVRPMLSIECRPLPDAESCSEREQLLWRSNLDAWLGRVPTLQDVLPAWLQFRVDRGEPFGALLLAFLEERPYTFISAIQFAGSEAEPEPYVTIINVGAPRLVGGWQIITGTNARYAFPEGFALAQGVCRVYLGTRGRSTENTCPGAFFTGAERLATSEDGYLLLTDGSGEPVDAVAWSQ